MNILKLAAQLTLDGSRFKAGIREAQAASTKFSNDVGKDVKNKLAGAFGVAALAYGVKRLIDFNSQIKDTADSLDISTKALQEQQFWITQNGGSVEDLVSAYRGLSKARAAALTGDDQKLSIFEALGLDQAALASQNLETIFAKAAEGFRNNDFGADRIAAVMEIFGKGGASIIPALSQSLSEASGQANELGQVIDEGVNAKLEEMGDILDQMSGRFKVFGSSLLVGVVKGIDAAVTMLAQGILGLGQAGLGVADSTLKNLGAITKSLGLGGFDGLRDQLKGQSDIYGAASDSLFNSMLDRYDPAKIGQRNKAGRGAGLFSEDDETSPEKIAAMEKLTFDKVNLPDIPASEVSGMTRAGQLGGRSFAYSNKTEERELEIAKQTLKVEQEQLAQLNKIARERSKILRVNP